jgi:hypothetical protein
MILADKVAVVDKPPPATWVVAEEMAVFRVVPAAAGVVR